MTEQKFYVGARVRVIAAEGVKRAPDLGPNPEATWPLYPSYFWAIGLTGTIVNVHNGGEENWVVIDWPEGHPGNNHRPDGITFYRRELVILSQPKTHGQSL